MSSMGNRGLGGTEQQHGHQGGHQGGQQGGQQANRPGAQTGGQGQGSRSHEGSMSDVASAVKDRASDLASSVASKAGDAWDSTKQAASSVASTAEDTWEEVSRFMRRYPIATFCVGVGVGVLLAQLMEGQGFSLGGRGSRDWGSYFSDFRSPFQQSERPDRERDFSYQGRA